MNRAFPRFPRESGNSRAMINSASCRSRLHSRLLSSLGGDQTLFFVNSTLFKPITEACHDFVWFSQS